MFPGGHEWNGKHPDPAESHSPAIRRHCFITQRRRFTFGISSRCVEQTCYCTCSRGTSSQKLLSDVIIWPVWTVMDSNGRVTKYNNVEIASWWPCTLSYRLLFTSHTIQRNPKILLWPVNYWDLQRTVKQCKLHRLLPLCHVTFSGSRSRRTNALTSCGVRSVGLNLFIPRRWKTKVEKENEKADPSNSTNRLLNHFLCSS